jgi:hypothetical protein
MSDWHCVTESLEVSTQAGVSVKDITLRKRRIEVTLLGTGPSS